MTAEMSLGTPPHQFILISLRISLRTPHLLCHWASQMASNGEVVRHVRRAHAKLHQPNNQTDSGKVHHANPQKHTQEYKNYLNILHENMMLLEDNKQ